MTTKRALIITDLTRFKPGKPDICMAGIDRETGECIRPMPHLPFMECTRLGILPGGILVGEFAFVTNRTAPHTEDCNYSNLKFAGPCSGEEFRMVLEKNCFSSLEDGFQISLPAGEKVIPPDHEVQHSIITLQVEPDEIEVVEDQYQLGKIKLHFTDASGREYRYLPITDLGFYDYAQRHRESSALDGLNQQISTQQAIFLRIGLSRKYRSPQGKEGFWVQVNGIYTFPDVLRYIRSYSAMETGRS
jgi:hypothetical protein